MLKEDKKQRHRHPQNNTWKNRQILVKEINKKNGNCSQVVLYRYVIISDLFTFDVTTKYFNLWPVNVSGAFCGYIESKQIRNYCIPVSIYQYNTTYEQFPFFCLFISILWCGNLSVCNMTFDQHQDKGNGNGATIYYLPADQDSITIAKEN